MKPYYQHAGITIYWGDCLEVMDELPAASVAAVVTDPPYSSGTRREGQKGLRKSMNRGAADGDWFGTDCLTTNGFLWLMRACARDWRRLLVDGGHVLSFIDWRMYPALAGAIESVDMRHAGLLVWDKRVFGMGSCFRNQHELIVHFTKGMGRPPARRDCPNVLSVAGIRGAEHETEKPEALIKKLLAVVTHPGDVVFDPFMGSGTSLVCAKALGRQAIGIEIEEKHCELAARRLDQELLPFSAPEIYAEAVACL